MARVTKKGPGTTRNGAVVGYIRVSTEQQSESGAGMAAQRHAIEQHCKHHGLVLAQVYEDDGVSAKSVMNRPGLSAGLRGSRCCRAVTWGVVGGLARGHVGMVALGR